MNSQELALLATIRTDPANDGPRQVYADWLEERGECGRAEFIRVQIERSQLDAYDPRHTPLVKRERELIDEHTTEWVGLAFRLFASYHPPPVEPPFEPLDPGTTRELMPQPRWFFRRGFPWVEVSAGQFLQNAEMLLDAAAVLQLHIGPDSYKEMVQRYRDPGSVRPRRELFERLLTSPHLPAEGIGLTLVQESDWDQFLGLARMQKLTALHARGATAYVWHIRELARAPGPAGMTELALTQMNLTDPAVRELAMCPWLRCLRSLDLSGNHVGHDGVAALTAAFSSGQLIDLNLSDNPIGDHGVQSLAGWPGLAALRVLRLEGCGIGPRGVAALAASPHLESLTHLGLQRNDIRGPGVAALLDPRGADWLDRLARLDLCGNRIGSLGVQHLMRANSSLPNLRRLFISEDRDDLEGHDVRRLEQVFEDRLRMEWFSPPR